MRIEAEQVESTRNAKGRRSSDIAKVRIGLIQARVDTGMRRDEQVRWQMGFDTTPVVEVEIVVLDALNSRGILRGRKPGKFFEKTKIDALAVAGTSNMDEFHRDTSTPEGRLRQRYHEQVDPLIQVAEEREMPVIGACFGAHEIVVALFGENTVGYVPAYEELETAKLIKTPAGRKSRLLAGTPDQMAIYSGHKGSIVPDELPDGAIVLLASTPRTPISVFQVFDTNIYGIQQHPEAHAAYVVQVDDMFDMLPTSGLSSYRRTGPLTPPHENAGRILGNFAEIVYDAKKNR